MEITNAVVYRTLYFLGKLLSDWDFTDYNAYIVCKSVAKEKPLWDDRGFIKFPRLTFGKKIRIQAGQNSCCSITGYQLYCTEIAHIGTHSVFAHDDPNHPVKIFMENIF